MPLKQLQQPSLSLLKTKTAMISMEATCFAASQPPLLHPKFPYPIKSSEIATTKSRLFICAVISKSSTVEISPKPTTPVSRGKTLQTSPPPLPRVSSASLQYPAGYLAARTEHPFAHAGDGEQRRRRPAVVENITGDPLYQKAISAIRCSVSHFLVQIVDFCCGDNNSSWLMKNKL